MGLSLKYIMGKKIGHSVGKESSLVGGTFPEPATKRVFDFLLAAVGFVIFLPVWIIISMVIYLEDGRPILFIQKRVGKSAKEFTVYKFRTIYRRYWRSHWGEN